jgi:hypothetical protein
MTPVVVNMCFSLSELGEMAVGWKLVIQRMLSVLSFRLVRLLFVAIQRINWELNGTARRLRRTVEPRHYKRLAHVLDVVMERHFCEWHNIAVQNFICTHNRFEHPEFVIKNEHVTLMKINDRSAIFAVAQEKGQFCCLFFFYFVNC